MDIFLNFPIYEQLPIDTVESDSPITKVVPALVYANTSLPRTHRRVTRPFLHRFSHAADDDGDDDDDAYNASENSRRRRRRRLA